MATAAAVWVDVLPDMSKFGSAMRKGVTPGAAAAGSGAGKSFGDAFKPDVAKNVRGSTKTLEKDLSAGGRRAGKKFGADFSAEAGGSFKKLAGVAAGAFAGVQVGSFFKGAITGASDLAETQSKIKQIFGDSSDAISAFASTASSKLGQTNQQALDANATFGIFGKSAGLAGKDLTGFTTDLTTLATDIASFNNTSPEEAINAIGSALRGEAEPLRAYGVLLDDQSMRQQALRMGLIKTTKEALTPQNKVLSAQALIMEQTKGAQGDFARTSGGLANQQRILAAKFGDAKAQLGNVFLPALTGVANFITDTVILAFSDLGGWLQRNREWLIPLGAAIAGLGVAFGIAAAVTALGGAVAAAGGFAAFATGPFIALWAAITGPVFLVVAGILALGAAFIYAYKKSDTFRAIVDKAWAGIKAAAMAAWDGYIKPALEALWQGMKVAGEWAQRMWTQYVQPAFVAIGGFIAATWNNVLKPVFGFLWSTIQTVAEVVMWLWRNVISPAFSAIGTIISVWWNSFVRPIFGIFMAALRTVGSVVSWLWRNAIAPAFEAIGKVIGWVWDNAIRPIFDKLKTAVGTIGDAFAAARDAVGRAWEGLKAKTSGPIQYVIDVVYNQGIRKVWNAVIDKFGGTPLNAITLGGGEAMTSRSTRGGIQWRAKGGYTPPGWTVVGEEGPELVNFTNPGRVYTADQTTQMFGGFGGIMEDIKTGLRVSRKVGVKKTLVAGATGALEFLGGPLNTVREQIANIGSTEWAGALRGMATKAVSALMDKARSMAASIFSSGGPVDPQMLAQLGATLGRTLFPMRGGYRVGMPPEWRGGYAGHTGQDFPAPVGTPLYAPFSGLLQQVAMQGSYGLHSNIYGPGGIRAILAHQSRFARGNGMVNVGDLIGFVGSSGNSSGPHLHLEYRRGGPIEPRNVTPFDTGGMLQPGYNLTYNGTGGPEPVLTGQQWAIMRDAASGAGTNVQVFIDGREIESAVVRVVDGRDQAMTNGLAYGQV